MKLEKKQLTLLDKVRDVVWSSESFTDMDRTMFDEFLEQIDYWRQANECYKKSNNK